MVRNSVIAMEPTFYEEQMYGSPGARALALTPGLSGAGPLKRANLSLDLNAASGGGAQAAGTPGTRTPGGSKRSRLFGSLGCTPGVITPLLSSPGDLLKLNSPEFEKLLIAQGENGITSMPTPTSQIYFEKAVTEEQEQYARGFVDALNELHHSDSSQEPGSIHGGGSGSTTYTNLEPPLHVGDSPLHLPSHHHGLLHHVKDEPQTVPSVSSSPGPMSPIDMESQERIKLERKRQRNRVAASKCRRRKLERISRLEDKVKLLKGENSDLSQVVNRLREHVARLKEQVIDHMHSGCQISSLPGII